MFREQAAGETVADSGAAENEGPEKGEEVDEGKGYEGCFRCSAGHGVCWFEEIAKAFFIDPAFWEQGNLECEIKGRHRDCEFGFGTSFVCVNGGERTE